MVSIDINWLFMRHLWAKNAIGRRRMDMEGIVNGPNVLHYAVRTRPPSHGNCETTNPVRHNWKPELVRGKSDNINVPDNPGYLYYGSTYTGCALQQKIVARRPSGSGNLVTLHYYNLLLSLLTLGSASVHHP